MTGPTNDSIYVEVIIHAPIHEVWHAWTEPDQIIRWFGSDAHGTGISAKLDVRAGGSFEVSFQDSDGTEHTCYGQFIAVVELSLLKLTWLWKSEPGHQSLVTVQLSNAGDHTLLTLQHAHLNRQSQHNYIVGWNDTFVKLERLLNKNDADKL